MMNMITNDNGETVVAIGAPGSIARVATQTGMRTRS